MRAWIWSFVLGLPIFAVGSTAALQFTQCLTDCYGVDAPTATNILEKVAPLLENEQYDSVIQSFMEESGRLRSASSTSQAAEGTRPSCHSVLFENERVRISWAVTKSGEQEPPQSHPWKTLMLIVHPSQFHSEQENGITYEDDWPIGVYLLEPSPGLLSCKNIGAEEFNGLIVEVKN